MKHLSTLFITVFFFTACSYIGTTRSDIIFPINAIELSAASAPKKTKGVFELTVKSSYLNQRLEFLNSENDYLDQRNLVIVLRPNAIEALKNIYGEHPYTYMLDKTIRVDGEAQRVKTWVLYKNKNTRKYFYQTKVFVKSANQITVL